MAPVLWTVACLVSMAALVRSKPIFQRRQEENTTSVEDPLSSLNRDIDYWCPDTQDLLDEDWVWSRWYPSPLSGVTKSVCIDT